MLVLIADDHRLIIEGVKLKLRELGDDVQFVEAETVAQLRDKLAQGPAPDVALIDMAMPGAEGVEHIKDAVAALRGPEDDGTSRQRPVIVLSGTEDPSAIRHVLDLGVQGYIPKSSPPDVILNAVRLVVGGGIYVPPEAMKAAVATGAPAFALPNGNDGLTARERLAAVLTDRQIDVLKLLAKGRPNKLIARELGISEGTVKIHLAAIFRALHVRNRLEALVAAQHLGD
ncbi:MULTISPECIES: LuxR C-terminal-related transcriptional regulator [Luteibacter]|uniref:Response regulator transcription factor n=1 Tax=Luteibacter flocculans TaxID=2780091 RepID=A0ABY4T6Y2_9GAMM|nr:MULTISPECIES: response regulator transcription factor [Luteibacter]URL59115.1 response regulator transcription factor [Luteibacter flocculans]SFW57120.1 DNA-binding response regulator, NarL/FixJ family, contains REC and HTH domains [Luteibacter sp. UNCMF366Tsu5.1]